MNFNLFTLSLFIFLLSLTSYSQVEENKEHLEAPKPKFNLGSLFILNSSSQKEDNTGFMEIPKSKENIDSLHSNSNDNYNNYEPGYVILKDETKKAGQLKIRFTNGNQLKFKDSTGKIIIDAAAVREFNKGGVNFVTFQQDSVTEFIELITKGNLTLYYQHHNMATGGSGIFTNLGGRYYIKMKGNNRMTLVDKGLNFKDQILSYIKDDEELKTLIINEYLKYKDIKTIIMNYNTWWNKQLNK